MPLGSINTSIQRLISKNLICKIDAIKGGKNATAIYFITSKNLSEYKKINHLSTNNNSTQNPYIYNNSNTTTTNDLENDSLIEALRKEIEEIKSQKVLSNENSEENTNVLESSNWDEVDFSELETFGFKKSHLLQIKKLESVTPEIVQDSINHYAWALHNRADEMVRYAPKNNRFKGLFGVLRKGSVWVEDGYIDPIDEAINKSLEAKKKQLEKIKKHKEEQLNLDFEIWKESLSEEEWQAVKEKIKKETSGRDSGGMFDAALKKHFKTNIKTSK